MKERKMRDDQTITVLVPNNPKKEGTAAHHMFNLYKTGMEVRAYVSAVRDSADERRALGLPPRADQGRAALLWDIERGFIRVDGRSADEALQNEMHTWALIISRCRQELYEVRKTLGKVSKALTEIESEMRPYAERKRWSKSTITDGRQQNPPPGNSGKFN